MPRSWMRRRSGRATGAVLIAFAGLVTSGAPAPSSAGRTAGPVAAAPSGVPATLDRPSRGDSVVVFAAHPDDESLGAGGLIHAAVTAGAHVTVVVFTNGDGYIEGVDVKLHTLFSTPGRFIDYGRARQEEAIAAAGRLGVSPSDVLFLGYPDRGLASLWSAFWDCRRPYVSPYTRRSRSPYTLAYHAGTAYCGESVLADIGAILNRAQPSFVVMHHPTDAHPDHWAADAFVTLAVERAALEGARWARGVRTYHFLVHRGGGWPAPRAYAPDQPLAPPAAAMAGTGPRWIEWPLARADEDAKRRAVLEYRSQLALSRAYLMSFVRQNELFDLAPPASVTWVPGGGPPLAQPEGWDGLPSLAHTTEAPSLVHAAEGSAVLEGVALGRTADRLLLAVRLRRPAMRELQYRMELRLFQPDGRVSRLILWFGVPASIWAEQRVPFDLRLPPGTAARSFGRRIHVEIPLAGLGAPNEGRPVAAYVRVVTIGSLRTAVDRMPWTLVLLAPAAPHRGQQ